MSAGRDLAPSKTHGISGIVHVFIINSPPLHQDTKGQGEKNWEGIDFSHVVFQCCLWTWHRVSKRHIVEGWMELWVDHVVKTCGSYVRGNNPLLVPHCAIELHGKLHPEPLKPSIPRYRGTVITIAKRDQKILVHHGLMAKSKIQGWGEKATLDLLFWELQELWTPNWFHTLSKSYNETKERLIMNSERLVKEL